MLTVTGKGIEQRFEDNLKDETVPRGPAPDRIVAASDVQELANLLTRFGDVLGLTLKAPVQDQVYVDRKSGVAFIEKFVGHSVHILQDCYDPEAKLRQSVHLQSLQARAISCELHEIPEFRPAAIGGAIAHYLGELALNGYRGTLEGHTGDVAYTSEPTIFIANTAPRNGKPHEQGAPFIYARLGYNIFYFGTNSGELSLLKDFVIGEPREIKIGECTTYRSRFLGKRAGEWREGDLTHFGAEIDRAKIEVAPRGMISWVDNFGNVKLNFTAKELFELGAKPGGLVTISNGKGSINARFVEKLEDGANGELLIAVGSSRANFGRDLSSNSADLYLKGNPRGQSAAEEICAAFGIEYRARERHHIPLPGELLNLAPAA